MRIGTVDVCKAVFALLICLYHFFNVVSPNPYLPLGDVMVELYVLIAGVFFFMSWEKKKAAGSGYTDSPYPYLKHRFGRFLPYSAVGFALAAAVRLWMGWYQGSMPALKEMLEWIPADLMEISMVTMNGLNHAAPLLNVPAWTLSAMLLAEFIVCMLLVNCEKAFKTMIAPLVILLGLGYWRFIPKANHQIWLGFTTFGLMRVFIIYCMSWYCYRLMLAIRRIRWTRSGKVMLTCAEGLLYALSLLVMTQYDSRNFRWLVTVFFIVAAAISISGMSGSVRLFPPRKWTAYLGEWSMGVYLTHYPIMRVFRTLYPGEAVLAHLPAYLAVVAAAAVAFGLVVRLVKMLCTRSFHYVKGKMTEN